MRRALATGATLAVAAAGATGCGSGSSGGSTTAASPGAKVFADTGCGSCHTLAEAGSTGSVGPKLDGRDYDVAAVRRWVSTGGSGMPSYAGQLSPEEIRAVAGFVAAASQSR